MQINLDQVTYTSEGVVYQGRKVKTRSKLWMAIRKAQATDDNTPGWLEADKDKRTPMTVTQYRSRSGRNPQTRTQKTFAVGRSGKNRGKSKPFHNVNGGGK